MYYEKKKEKGIFCGQEAWSITHLATQLTVLYRAIIVQTITEIENNYAFTNMQVMIILSSRLT